MSTNVEFCQLAIGESALPTPSMTSVPPFVKNAWLTLPKASKSSASHVDTMVPDPSPAAKPAMRRRFFAPHFFNSAV